MEYGGSKVVKLLFIPRPDQLCYDIEQRWWNTEGRESRKTIICPEARSLMLWYWKEADGTWRAESRKTTIYSSYFQLCYDIESLEVGRGSKRKSLIPSKDSASSYARRGHIVIIKIDCEMPIKHGGGTWIFIVVKKDSWQHEGICSTHPAFTSFCHCCRGNNFLAVSLS